MQFLIRFYLFLCLVFVSILVQAQHQQLVILVPAIEVYDLQKIDGDCDIYGHNPQISISASACVNGGKVVVSGLIKIKENRADWTTFTKEFRQEIYVRELANQEVVFASFQESEGALKASGGMHQHHYKSFEGHGLIKSANILSDTNGLDCGKLGGTIQFQPLVMYVNEVL